MNKRKYFPRLKLIGWLLRLGVALIIGLTPGCVHRPAPVALTATQAQALSALRTAQAATFTTNAPVPIVTTPAPEPAAAATPVVQPAPEPVKPAAPPVVQPAPRQSDSLPISNTASPKPNWRWYFLLALLPVGGAGYYFWPKISAWLAKQKVLTEIESFAKAAEKDILVYWKDIQTEADKLLGKTPPVVTVPVVPKVLPKPAIAPKFPELPPSTIAHLAPPEVAAHANASWATSQTAGK